METAQGRALHRTYRPVRSVRVDLASHWHGRCAIATTIVSRLLPNPALDFRPDRLGGRLDHRPPGKDVCDSLRHPCHD